MADTEKWVALNESYDHRIALMSKYIKPFSSVLDLGAGLLGLKRYLPEGCSYQPCDLCKRDENTFVGDFNKNEFPPYKHYDYVFCSGVLEYMQDLDTFIERIVEYSDMFIISYVVKCKSTTIEQRKSSGWINHYNLGEIVGIFLRNGLLIKKVNYFTNNMIFYLTKEHAKKPGRYPLTMTYIVCMDFYNRLTRTSDLKKRFFRSFIFKKIATIYLKVFK